MLAKLLAAALLAGGCNAILGLEDVQEVDDDDGAGGSSTSSSAAGGSATSAGGMSGTGGMAGVGGAGGMGVCDASTLGTASGCDAGFKCSITSVPNGPPGCVSAGSRPAWASCTVDSQCAVGTWCDLVREVCKPVCNANACPGNGSCNPAPDGNSGVVTDLMVCTADCEPVGASPCNQSSGDVTCVRTPAGLDCMTSGGLSELQSCVTDYQCAPGLMCYSGSYCNKWCTVGGNDCPSGYFCANLSPKVYSQDMQTEFGTCALM